MPEELRRPSLPARASGPEPRSLLSPWTAFALVLLILAATGIWLLSRRSPAPASIGRLSSPPAVATPSDADAIRRLKELANLRFLAYRHLDRSLISEIAIGGSPFARRFALEIQQLSTDGVFPRPNFKTLDVDVIETSENQILLEEMVVARTHFVDASGRDITTKSNPQRQLVEWTMRWDGSKWLIYESEIKESEAINHRKRQ